MSVPTDQPRKRLRALEDISKQTPDVDNAEQKTPQKTPRVLVPATPDSPIYPPTPPEEQFYSLRSSDIVLNKYCVRGSVGYGTAGTVVKAEDRVTGRTVAVKIFHNGPASPRSRCRREGRVYEKLLAGCNTHSDLFAAVLGSGMHRGFYCVVFDFCDCTLGDILENQVDLLPLPARHVMEIGFQLVKAIEYLHSFGIAHTDLKADNVALRSLECTTVQWLDPQIGFKEKRILVSAQICVIDLGDAIELPLGMGMPGRVGVRQYRAPEVVLGLPWSFGVDIFAIGCIIVELHLMTPLFSDNISSDREHLSAFDRVLGPYPTAYALWVDTKFPLTFSHGERVSVRYPPADTPPSRDVHLLPMQRLEALKPLSARLHDIDFHSLCRHLMALDPDQRLSGTAAAKHKYFDRLQKVEMQ